MSARSFQRGWPTVFQEGQWVYEDTSESVEVERPCVHCGELPTPEGYDACLGYIPGVKAACCGHGVEKGFIILREE